MGKRSAICVLFICCKYERYINIQYCFEKMFVCLMDIGGEGFVGEIFNMLFK